MSDSYKLVVKAGAALLDKFFGKPNWRLQCEGMKIDDPNDCILTRLFGSYNRGLYMLCLMAGRHHGFDLGWQANTYSYELLQKAWEDEFANPPLGTDDE